ncbi:hypothetical protein BJ166DRAFT_596212 [Pestalotiopsis sp. NC0098]|nr:hypothetical protein BJ166DRAFT_596212 [Pestalotiopsis sp. NC0098]
MIHILPSFNAAAFCLSFMGFAAGSAATQNSAQGTLSHQPRTCTTTLTLNPPQVAGLVSTAYRSTATETVRVTCNGCSLAVTTQAQGFGPPPKYTSTTTAAKTTATTYSCD